MRSVLTNHAEAERTMKRFWKKASVNLVDGKYTVTLDGRNLRTPSKNKIQLPPNRKQLAQLLAAEWDGQTSNLKPHSLPLVRITATHRRFFWLLIITSLLDVPIVPCDRRS